ncbi:MAG TPA: hypothetical protein VNJ53_05110, partial [Gaiellaceae bacterium]|nr:hypothetical protein [Gaiellaceae bacterium]
MRVVYFGTYEREYPRNALVISALRRAGVEVEEVHVPLWAGREHKFALSLALPVRLAAGRLRLQRARLGHFDVLVVGY